MLGVFELSTENTCSICFMVCVSTHVSRERKVNLWGGGSRKSQWRVTEVEGWQSWFPISNKRPPPKLINFSYFLASLFLFGPLSTRIEIILQWSGAFPYINHVLDIFSYRILNEIWHELIFDHLLAFVGMNKTEN